MKIACEAAAATEVAVVAQSKRRYYRPAGRQAGAEERGRARRDKVSMERPQILQRLVYSESEPFERAQEEAGGGRCLTEEDMVVRFLKHLVRITVRRNAFYVALGLGRLLYRFSTDETARLYDAVLQNPDRFPEDHYFRSRKQQLLQEIDRRFGHAIRIVRGPRGEKRLEPRPDSGPLQALVEAALGMFTPWGTACVVPTSYDPTVEELTDLRFRGSDADAEHPVEVRRMHALLHPECLRRLFRALGFGEPDARLTLPRLHLDQEDGGAPGPPDDRSALPRLSSDERHAIVAELGARASRRRGATIGALSISVDGRELGRLHPERHRRARFEIPDSAERLDVRHLGEGQPLLLATYLFGPGDEVRSTSHARLRLEGGQDLTFDAAPLSADDRGGEPARRQVVIGYRETRPRRAMQLWWRRVRRQPAPRATEPRGAGPRQGLAWALSLAIVCGIGWLVYRQGLGPAVPPPPAAAEPRDQVSQVPQAVTDTDQAPRVLRGETPPSGSISLAEVEAIYVEDLGSEALRQALIAALEADRRLKVADSRAVADAVLKPAPPGDGGPEGAGREDTSGIGVLLRLVSRGGEVLWQGSPEGEPAEAARRILVELHGDD